MVKAAAVANNVRAPSPAAVVLDLAIGLVGLLWRQKTRTGTKIVLTSSKASGIAANGQFDVGERVVNTSSDGCVHDSVAEFHVAEANAVRVGSGVEVQAERMDGRVIHIVEGLEGVGQEGSNIAELIVGEKVKKLVPVIDLPIDTSHTLHFTNRRVVTAGDRGEVAA